MDRFELNEKFFWLFVKNHEFIDYVFARHKFVPGGLSLWAHNRLGDSDDEFVVSTVVTSCGLYSKLEDFKNEYWAYGFPRFDQRPSFGVEYPEFEGICLEYLKEKDAELYDFVISRYKKYPIYDHN